MPTHDVGMSVVGMGDHTYDIDTSIVGTGNRTDEACSSSYPCDGASSSDDCFTKPKKTAKCCEPDDDLTNLISGPLSFASAAIACPVEEPPLQKKLRFYDEVQHEDFEIARDHKLKPRGNSGGGSIHVHRQWDGFSKEDAQDWNYLL